MEKGHSGIVFAMQIKQQSAGNSYAAKVITYHWTGFDVLDALTGGVDPLHGLYRSAVYLVVSHLLRPVADKPRREVVADAMGGGNVHVPGTAGAVVGFAVSRVEVKNIIERNAPVIGQIADGDIGFKRPVIPGDIIAGGLFLTGYRIAGIGRFAIR